MRKLLDTPSIAQSLDGKRLKGSLHIPGQRIIRDQSVRKDEDAQCGAIAGRTDMTDIVTHGIAVLVSGMSAQVRGFIRQCGPERCTIDTGQSGGKDENHPPQILCLSGIVAAAPLMSTIAWAQTQAAPKLSQILRKDLEGQGLVVQETVVSVVNFGPGAAAPWHMLPGAQELLHVIEGSLGRVEGGETKLLKAGEAGIVTADLVISPATIVPT